MRNLIAILFFCLALTATAATRITATITVTNVPAHPNTLVVNANTRTWTNSTAGAPQSGILIGASVGASATNLFRQISSYPYSPILNLGFSSSNVITLQGGSGVALAASLSGTWGAITFSTNQVSDMVAVRVPLSGEIDPAGTNRAYIASQLVIGLNTYPTNAFTAGTTLLGNLVQTTGDQTVGGIKSFTNLVVSGYQSVTGFLAITNSQPQIGFHDSLGAANVDQQKSILYVDSFGFQFYFLDSALNGVETFSIYRGTSNEVSRIEGFGKFKVPYIYDSGITNGTTTNMTFTATNINTGTWANTRTNVSSLANGVNSGLDFGGKVFVKLKAGPTAAFSIAGITGGSDGRLLVIYNSIAQNMTISNDSGTEAVPANRIYTMTGADIATTGVGVVTLRYDSEDSRWIVQNSSP